MLCMATMVWVEVTEHASCCHRASCVSGAQLASSAFYALHFCLQGDVEAARIAAVGRKYADEMWARLPPERQQGGSGSGSSGSGGSGSGSQGQVRWIVDKMLRNWW